VFTVKGTKEPEEENVAPIATDDTFVVTLDEENGDVDGNVLTKKSGDGRDRDPDGDNSKLKVYAVDGKPKNVGKSIAGDNGGLIIINADGTVDFDANGEFDDLGLNDTKDTSVTYTIIDENGGMSTATATFTVTGINNGTVEGTDRNDVINPEIPYVDADGDIVDANDGILPGDEGTNNDLIYGYGGDDSIDAGKGNDIVYGGEGHDDISGNDGDDTLHGNTGNDTVHGNSGDDIVYGGKGDDEVRGGIGDDTVYGGIGNDIAYGGTGNDYIDTSNPNENALPDVGYPFQTPDPDSVNKVPFPGYDADKFRNNDKDTVYGGAGNDRIITGDDDDSIIGGTGDDFISAGYDDDTVAGQKGNDTIEGGEGNDSISGGKGNDTIYGGLENPLADLVSFPDDYPDKFGFQDLVPENNGDLIYGGEGEDVVYGQDDDDTIYGDAGRDTLYGGVDDDELYGGGGEDIIHGDEGMDEITGGKGADELYGGYHSDTFYGGTAGDVVVGGEDDDDSDVDVLDLSGEDVDRIEYVEDDPEAGTVFFKDGSTMTFSEIENVIPCFTPGTTIATPHGERLVEELKVGDRVITRDNGIQKIAWVGHKPVSGAQLIQNPHLKPILIKEGSLGHGLPERDMMVSPNHRVLVASEKTQLYFDESEVLAAAKHMAGTDGIHALDVTSTTYIHFMFENHEVVLSNGAWTESFQPGDYTLKGIGNSQRNEIFELFPELATQTGVEGYQSARKALKKHEAKLLWK
jgi:Ca2+-binding RTX toxin-like protein